MSRASQILGRRMRLPRPQTYDVVCEQDLPATMEDGVTLLADRWVARDARDRPQPTVLVRSPYGRRQFVGLLFGRLFAERGLQVVIQSVRGTFGSGGEFNPFVEREDGLATLRWLREQPWHAGGIGMMGPSYLGLVQWAVAPDAGDDLAALAIQVSASQFHGQTYAGGSLSLETIASWLVIIAAQERRAAPLAMMRALRALRPLLAELPLDTLDERVAGAPVAWFREGLTAPDASAPYWTSRDYTAGVARVTAPVQMITGWHDILLPWMLEDYAALESAGRTVQLIIGPWTHTAPGLAAAGDRLGLGWLRAHLLGDDRMLRPERVRIFVTGERAGGGWRAVSSWPLPGTGEHRLYTGPGGSLSPDPSPMPIDGSSRYIYDPAQPTPSVGGPVLLESNAVTDNRRLEARPDVLTFTTAPLEESVEAIGPVRVELYVRASRPYFDVFARVCDVSEAGASMNVTDALVRIAPGRFDPADGDDVHRVAFDLWPIGHRFAAGHRIRLQVSSGAHPRYARNPGTGEDPLVATGLEPVEIALLHGAEHPSVVILPRAGALTQD